MRSLKCDLWKIGIFITNMLFLFVLLTWTSVSVANAHEVTSGLAAPTTVTVQATPTEDATVIALNKEKLAQEVQQLKNQNEPDPLGWLRTNASFLFSTLVVVGGGLFGLWRWRVDRRDAQDKELKDRQNAQDKELEDRKAEREKRAEERFQAAVMGLGDEKEGVKAGSAILLRTFLRPGYEQFYTQTFDLAVAHLRLPRTVHPLKDPDTPLPLTTLSQALIVVFKEAFPRARDELEKQKEELFDPRLLDASHIQLDNAYLAHANLSNAWMPEAFLRKANLGEANLSKANLRHANFTEAHLGKACLDGANLRHADLSGVVPNEGTFLIDLSSISLKDTDLRGVKGLTKEQLAACKAKGAIIDEDPTTSSSQSTVAPSPSLQSDDAQASSAPSAQGSLPAASGAGSIAASSQQDSAS